MPPTKIQRWLDLLAFLTARRFGATRAEIMDGVPAYSRALAGDGPDESVRRMFERDKRELLELGIPLETREVSGEDPEEQAVYRLRSTDFYLPYLRILAAEETGPEGEGARGEATRGGAGDPGGPVATETPRVPGLTLPRVEIPAEDLGRAAEAARRVRDLPDSPLAPEADSAFRKLTFDLGPGWTEASGAELVARGDPAPVVERTRLLRKAMAAGKAVRFTYTGAYRPGTEERHVHPYGLLFRFNRWYLVGHDVDRDALRLFRLGRMEALSVNTRAPGTPDFTRPADFTLEPWRRAEPWSLPADDVEVVEVTVRFDFPRSLLVERAELGTLVDTEPGGVALRRFRVHQTDAFLRWLLSLQGEGTIVDPPELRDALGRMAREVAALYGGGAADREVRGGEAR